jgi:plastocyanin
LVAAALLAPPYLLGQGVPVQGAVVNGGTPLSEAAVYLEALDQPSEPQAPDQNATIDQIHLRFVPSVVVVPPGTEVRFLNSDPLPHNVFGPGGRVDEFDLGTYPQGLFQVHRFDEEGVHMVLCHIHPQMVAYVVVANALHRATTSADGLFSMDGVPPGRYRLHAWHPRRPRESFQTDIVVESTGVSGLRITLGSGR